MLTPHSKVETQINTIEYLPISGGLGKRRETWSPNGQQSDALVAILLSEYTRSVSPNRATETQIRSAIGELKKSTMRPPLPRAATTEPRSRPTSSRFHQSGPLVHENCRASTPPQSNE